MVAGLELRKGDESNPPLSACFEMSPSARTLKGFLVIFRRFATRPSSSIIRAGCFTVSFELMQFVSRSEFPQFKSIPPFRRSANKLLSGINPSSQLRTPKLEVEAELDNRKITHANVAG
jgi:hypothetical protein